MKDWIERLAQERAELMEKYRKLSHFKSSCNWSECRPEQARLLTEQFDVMGQYLAILDKRLEDVSNI